MALIVNEMEYLFTFISKTKWNISLLSYPYSCVIHELTKTDRVWLSLVRVMHLFPFFWLCSYLSEKKVSRLHASFWSFFLATVACQSIHQQRTRAIKCKIVGILRFQETTAPLIIESERKNI